MLFEVDAGQLDRTKELKQHKLSFDRIVFNYPHVGASEKDEARNIALNQVLVLRFLSSAAAFLAPGPSPIAEAAAPLSSKKRKRKHTPDVDEPEDEPVVYSDEEAADAQLITARSEERGSILLTLRNTKPYTLWLIPYVTLPIPVSVRSRAH